MASMVNAPLAHITASLKTCTPNGMLRGEKFFVGREPCFMAYAFPCPSYWTKLRSVSSRALMGGQCVVVFVVHAAEKTGKRRFVGSVGSTWSQQAFGMPQSRPQNTHDWPASTACAKIRILLESSNSQPACARTRLRLFATVAESAALMHRVGGI